MKTTSIRTLLLAAGVAAGALGGLALPGVAQAAAYVSVQIGPPPMRAEVVPPPRAGWVWAPGHYEWRSNAHFWVPGVWVRERPGYMYVPPRWSSRGDRWEYYPSRWDTRPGYRPAGDYDRDGVPNRYDRYPGRGNAYGRDRDRDGVRDRYDHDRDGDGVPNRHDRRPDNRYRY